MVEDSYCQGPKPRELASCEASRRRREDRGAADDKREFSSARSSTIKRQNDFIRGARVTAKAALSGAIVEDRHPDDLSAQTIQTADSSNRSCLIGYVNTLPSETSLISTDAIRNSPKTRRRDRSRIDKRHDKEKKNLNKIKKGEVVVDKEDIQSLTLTIILERDEKNVVTNFPKNFEPQPPENSTEFTLVGMDALRYIQRIQEEARASSEVSIFRE